MDSLKFLSRREIKDINLKVKSQWSSDYSIDCAALISEKQKIFVASDEIAGQDVSKLRINNIGLYFGELSDAGLRLSIEGSQLVGKTAKKNVVVLDDKNAELWMQGNNIDVEGDHEGFVIVRHNDDLLGSGKFREGKVFNFVPKPRRVQKLV